MTSREFKARTAMLRRLARKPGKAREEWKTLWREGWAEYDAEADSFVLNELALQGGHEAARRIRRLERAEGIGRL